MESEFKQIPFAAPDSMFQMMLECDQDPYPGKINLGPGAYRDENGKPWILPSIRHAESVLQANHPGHEYLPLLGFPAFRSASASILFGADSPRLAAKEIATIQTISGSGAIHMAAVFIMLFSPRSVVAYVSNPSWPNHRVMFEQVGFEVRDYSYYERETNSIPFREVMATLDRAPIGSAVILQACAHNPTGIDFDRDQWKQVVDVVEARKLIPVVDSAYQGFASGDLYEDAWSVRYIFEERGLSGLVCQSFSKNMGLYGERVGALHVVVPRGSESRVVSNIESQLAWISRKEISNANRYRATLASTVLMTPAICDQWHQDLRTMSTRLAFMRERLVERLINKGVPGDWHHITRQIGMFCYSGISAENARRLRARHVYIADSGRISICGFTEGNIERFCEVLYDVLRSDEQK